MVHGGAAKTNSGEELNEKLAKMLVEYSRKHPELQKKILTAMVAKDPSLKLVNPGDKSSNALSSDELLEVMRNNPELIKIAQDHFKDNPEELKDLLEQANKVEGMEKKLNDMDKKFSDMTFVATMALLGVGTLVGVLIAGPVGALIGLAVVTGILMFAALFANRGEIKESIQRGVEHIGDAVKDVTQSLKNFINEKSPGKSHEERLDSITTREDVQKLYNKEGNPLPDHAAFNKQYLLDKDGFQALKSLIVEQGGKITLKDKNNENVELKLEDLATLKNAGKGHSQNTKDIFDAQLDKFKFMMDNNSTNKGIRTQVEEKQDKIHKEKGLQTSAPSSACSPGSIANNAVLSKVDSGEKRTGMKNFLENASKLEKPFREQSGGLYEILEKDPYNLNREALNNLEKKGSELGENTLNELAGQLNKLEPKQIKDLNAKINDLKKEQSKGPQSRTSEVKDPAQHAPPQQSAGIPTP